jgi:tetratricopeptide (TPR) repeat protein
MKNFIELILEKQNQSKKLIIKGKKYRKFKKLDLAKQHFKEAIIKLIEANKIYNNNNNQNFTEYELDINLKLSDAYGILGGVYRRANELDKSVDMYKKGAYIEDKYNVEETYNRTNFIALNIIKDEAIKPEIQKEIERVLKVAIYLTEGTNRNKWWAWSDKALLLILNSYNSDISNEVAYQEEVINCYDQFGKKGAVKNDFKTTIEVLYELKNIIKPCESFTTALFKEVLKFLVDNMPKNIAT